MQPIPTVTEEVVVSAAETPGSFCFAAAPPASGVTNDSAVLLV